MQVDEIDVSSSQPAMHPLWGKLNQRISKHAGGWSPKIVNGVLYHRWKLLARRRAVKN